MAEKINYAKILRGGDNKPTNPELWEKAKAAAKAKFDVYPSAVANAWASRYYAEKGGDWKSMADGGEVTLSPEEMSLSRRRRRELPDLYPLLDEPQRQRKQQQKAKQQRQEEERTEETEEPAQEAEQPVEEMADGGKVTLEKLKRLFAEAAEAEAKRTGKGVSYKDGNTTRVVIRGEDKTPYVPEGHFNSLRWREAMDEITEGLSPEEKAQRIKEMEAQKEGFEKAKYETRKKKIVPSSDEMHGRMPSGLAEGGMIGSMANIAAAIGKEQESPFPEITQVGFPMENKAAAKLKSPQPLAQGGYVVTRSNERKGKTHKVTGPDGSVKFFGDPNLKNRPNNPEAKASWYARHAKSLKANPHFRAYARSTWAEGGMVADEPEYFQDGGIGGDLPLPEFTTPLTDAELATSGLSEEEKQRIKEKQEADARAAGVEVIEPQLAPPTPSPTDASTIKIGPATPIQSEPPKGKVTFTIGKPTILKPKEEEPEDTLASDYKERLKPLEKMTADEYATNIKSIEEQATKLSASERDELFTELGKIQTARRATEKFAATKPPADIRRSPLSQVREDAARVEKYGDRYSQYAEFRKQALNELGGELPLTGDPASDARTAQRNSFRQRAAEKIADDMMASQLQVPAEEVPAEAPSEEGRIMPIPPAAPEQPLAIEPTAAVLPAAGERERKPFVEGAEQAARADLVAEQAGLRALAEPTGVLKLLQNSGVQIDQLDDPKTRYSDATKTALEQLGDYQVTFGLARKAGYDPVNANKIATDEVLRGAGTLGGPPSLGPIPSGLGAMEAARETPEYKQAAEAARLQAQIMQETARIDALEKKVAADLKTTAIDLELRKASEYELKKRVLDAQATELRRQINEARIEPQRLFSGDNFVPSVIAAGLDLIGSGFGSKDSVLNYIDGRINRDLQLQMQELGRNKTLLGDLLKQGNDLDDAFKLSQAFYKQLFALQIEKSTATLGSEKARLQGLSASAKLLQDAAKTQEEVLRKQVDTIYEPYKIRLQNADKGLKSVTDLLKAQIVKPPRPAAAKAPKEPEPAAYLDFTNGVPINTGKWAEVTRFLRRNKMGTDIIDSSVKQVTIKPSGIKFERKDGSQKPADAFSTDPNIYRLAKNPTAAKAVESADVVAEKFFAAMNDLEKIAAKYNYSRPVKIPSNEKAIVEKAVADMASYLGGEAFYNIGVPQEAEYQRIKDLVPNLDFFATTGFTESRFDQFRKDVGNVIINARNRNLVGGLSGTAAAGTPAPAAPSAMPPPVRKPPVRGK